MSLVLNNRAMIYKCTASVNAFCAVADLAFFVNSVCPASNLASVNAFCAVSDVASVNEFCTRLVTGDVFDGVFLWWFYFPRDVLDEI